MHFFAFLFGHIKKKQYLCTRFCEMTKKSYIVNRQIVNVYGGHSSVGRASDCGSECRGFEPHIPP